MDHKKTYPWGGYNRAITIAEMREWENATWAAGIEEEPVMCLAGKAVADCVLRLTKPGDRVMVLAGIGKNGGDAIYASEYMPDRKVELVNIKDPGEVIARVQGYEGEAVVDGLFGIGLNRPLSECWAALVEALNANTKIPFKVCVDNPSGLDCDSGEALGGIAVKCTHTVTFGAMKQGLLNDKAKLFTGEVEVAEEIGLLPFPFH